MSYFEQKTSMLYSKQKSNNIHSKISSVTDTESIERLLDTIESKLDDDVFKNIMNSSNDDYSQYKYQQNNQQNQKQNNQQNQQTKQNIHKKKPKIPETESIFGKASIHVRTKSQIISNIEVPKVDSIIKVHEDDFNIIDNNKNRDMNIVEIKMNESQQQINSDEFAYGPTLSMLSTIYNKQ